MARRLIGLDVGTNAVTIAEVTPGTPPRLDMFAQVALPREAMREGEVNDVAAVADAVARLRSEVGLKKAAVRVGIASPRVVVRQVEMPLMTREELASALQFQAADLIPIPIEDAVLDFAILATNAPSAPDADGHGGEPTMQVLLAAAQEATIAKLVTAVEQGGLHVAAVDLIPLALTRALARPVPAMAAVAPAAAGGVALADDVGAEGIVSFGGGVTAIAVHEGGVPRFVRVLASGGRELTDSIAHDLEVPIETAESLKRAVGTQTNDEAVMRARTAMDRPLSVLLDEVRSSIDYYRNQPGAARLLRVVATGGSAQLPGLPERLSALVGVQVEPAYMGDLLRVGNIGFAPEELPRLEPYLPAAVGLALGGAGVGTVVDLKPQTRRSTSAKLRPKLNPRIGAGIAAAILVVGGVSYLQHNKAANAKAKQADAQTELQKAKNDLARWTNAGAAGKTVNLQPIAAHLLSGDVSWSNMVRSVGSVLPPGVWLTSFQAQHTLSAAPATSGATTNGSAAPTGQSVNAAVPALANTSCSTFELPLSGTVTIAGVAKNVPSLAAFLDALAKLGGDKAPELVSVFPGSTQGTQFGGVPMLSFTINASLGDGARSDRLQHYFREALCK